MTVKSRSEEQAENRRVWEQHIHNWKESGLRQSEYCRRHNLKEHQLSYWKRKFQPVGAPISLVELELGASFQSGISATRVPLRLIVCDQYRIEVERGFDPVALQQLVLTLRQL
jgi:hypothetical protein